MISIIGIGNGGSAIADLFSPIKNYDVYCLNNSVLRNTETHFKLETYATAEEYEKNIPQVGKFFAETKRRVQVFVVGSSMSSNFVLGILEPGLDFVSW